MTACGLPGSYCNNGPRRCAYQKVELTVRGNQKIAQSQCHRAGCGGTHLGPHHLEGRGRRVAGFSGSPLQASVHTQGLGEFFFWCLVCWQNDKLLAEGGQSSHLRGHLAVWGANKTATHPISCSALSPAGTSITGKVNIK